MSYWFALSLMLFCFGLGAFTSELSVGLEGKWRNRWLNLLCAILAGSLISIISYAGTR